MMVGCSPVVSAEAGEAAAVSAATERMLLATPVLFAHFGRVCRACRRLRMRGSDVAIRFSVRDMANMATR